MKCSICGHDRRDEINSALLGSASLRDIAARFRVAKSSLHRHRANCLGPKVAAAFARYEELDEQRLISDLLGARERLMIGILRTSSAQEYGAMVAMSGELRKTVELAAKLAGFLESGTRVTIDARKQLAVIANLSDEELDALVRAGLDDPARDALVRPLVSDPVGTSPRALPVASGREDEAGALAD